jgi:hypothetical protein
MAETRPPEETAPAYPPPEPAEGDRPGPATTAEVEPGAGVEGEGRLPGNQPSPPFPWDVFSALVLLVLAVVIFSWYRRERRHRQAREAWMAEVHRACEEDALTAAEEQALLRALRHLDVTVPEASVESEPYFEAFVEPALRREADAGTAAAIRRKLFGAGAGASA